MTELLTDNAEMLLPNKSELSPSLGKQVNEFFLQNISKSLYHQHNTQLLGANYVNSLRVICTLDGTPLPFAQCLVMDHCLVQLMASECNPISQICIFKNGDVKISCPVSEKGTLNWNADRWIDVASFRQHDWTQTLESCTVEEKTYGCY